jgi:hypothetical protein
MSKQAVYKVREVNTGKYVSTSARSKTVKVTRRGRTWNSLETVVDLTVRLNRIYPEFRFAVVTFH